MFKIVINHEVMAVSETMESAIKALPGVICDYADIGNSNLIHWDNNGIIVNPECNIATANVTVLDIAFDIFICKVKLV
jgi:hypothetical protein